MNSEPSKCFQRQRAPLRSKDPKKWLAFAQEEAKWGYQAGFDVGRSVGFKEGQEDAKKGSCDTHHREVMAQQICQACSTMAEAMTKTFLSLNHNL